MKKTIAGVVASLTLVATGTAQAHNTDWYWTRSMAESTILDEGLPWVYPEYITDVGCHGTGDSWRSKQGNKMFRHFRCYAETPQDYSDFILHVRGKYKWSVNRVKPR
jgi:hypothetical protein